MDDPLQRTLEELLAPLGESKLFGAPQEKQFRIEQQLTTAGVCERVASTSFVAAMPAEDREALLEQVRAPAAGREEPFAFPYVTEVYVAARGV